MRYVKYRMKGFGWDHRQIGSGGMLQTMEDRDDTTGITLGHLETDLSFATRVLRSRMQARNAGIFREHGLAGGEVALVCLIGQNPGLSQKALAEAVVLRKSALTKHVNDMETAGLIERRKVGGDLRLNTLWLTAKGEALYDGVRTDMIALQDDFLSPLSRGERAILFELLWRLTDAMAGAPDGQGHAGEG